MTRVFWHMGQALLPEHFYAQEESLRAEASLRFSMLSTPSWGLGDLEWDPFLLETGKLSIKRMALVFESGSVVDIPGNAAPIDLDLTGVGHSRMPLFVQLQSGFDVVETRPGDPAEEGIQRIVQRVALSASQSSAEQTFQLAEVECDADGRWAFAKDYVPPLLRVKQNLLFDGLLERMEGLLNQLRHALKEELQENHLSGETHVLAKQALRSLFSFNAALVDLRAGIAPHPYELFTALRTLYIDTCVLRNVQSLEAIEKPYDHKALARTFARLLDPLERLLARGRPEVPYVEFARKDGLLFCDIQKNVKRARDVFLLVQKPHVASSVDLGRTKLSSPTRLHLVHERALTGIPFSRIERPPFAQSLSSAVEIYAVSRGQEWDYAVGEGRIVLFDSPELDGCRLYLYSRVD
jgi:type VI secretion system protein ImpJ